MINSIIKYSFIGLLLLVFTSLLVLSWVPPISRDALIHHLAIPKLYLLQGGIFEIPDLIFSYYPMNLDLLYMIPLALDHDIIPKYIHMAFGLATALLLHRYLINRLPAIYAYLGTLFFLSIPIIVKLSITVYVDLGLTFFTTASILLLFQWIEKNCQTRYLIWSGICCGLAIGTKYNGLLILFLLAFFIPILYSRARHEKDKFSVAAFRASMLFCFCALLVASPWLIRNAVWTGNPIYPLYNGLFNPSEVSNTIAATTDNTIRGVFATRHVLYGESLWQLLLLPVRIFFEGMDNDPRYFDGRLNPFLLLLPMLAFLRGPKLSQQLRIEKTTLLVFCFFYFLFAFNTGVLRIRYLVPMVPFLVILAMFGLHNIETYTKNFLCNRYIQVTVWLLPIFLMLSLNGMYIFQQFQYVAPLSYISGHLSRDEYLIKYLPEYKVMQYVNKGLPKSSKILCLFMGWRGYYLEREHIFDSPDNSKWLIGWLNEIDVNANIILQRLNKNGISHLLIRRDLFNEWAQKANTTQPNIGKILAQNLFSPIAEYQNYTLYKVNFH
jgi:hypothetical protein